jgi:glycosyltransferase involved in cell wall biosynthesis
VDDPRPFLWAADALVLPSEREGIPNVVLEAMACGTPCVAPASAGGEDVLGSGGGVIPADNSPDQLAPAIALLLGGDGREQQLRADARAAAGRFSLDAVAQRYTALYDSLPSWS